MQKLYVIVIGYFHQEKPHSFFVDDSLASIQRKLRSHGYVKGTAKGKECAYYEHRRDCEWAKVYQLPLLKERVYADAVQTGE